MSRCAADRASWRPVGVVLAAASGWLVASTAAAFTLNGTAWDPGPFSARIGGSPAPGGATWSIVGPGVGLSANLAAGSGGVMDLDHRPVATTRDFDLLLDAPGREIDIVGEVLDAWARHSAFENLGPLADGGAPFGASGLLAGLADIRIGVLELFPRAPLAHAFRPSTGSLVASGGTAGGDIHLDANRIWVDDANDTHPLDDDTFDLYTVLLHEVGHALGLGHSLDPDAVMFAGYTGARRALGADDLAGIQAIYGVPEPSTAGAVSFGLAALAWRRRQHRRTA